MKDPITTLIHLLSARSADLDSLLRAVIYVIHPVIELVLALSPREFLADLTEDSTSG